MATITILPDVDVTTDWTEEPSGAAWSTIDEDVSGTPSDADYIETTTIDQVCEVEFAATPANLSECTAITLMLRGVVTDVATSALVEVALTHSAGTHVTGSPVDVDGVDFGGTYGTIGNETLSFPGLTLNKTQMDSLQAKFTFRAS